MTEAAINDAEGESARDDGGRAILWLVVAFLIAFSAATAIQIKAHHDDAARNIMAAQVSITSIIAERLSANLAGAAGAADAFAELERVQGAVHANPMSAATAAKRATAAAAVAIVDQSGAIEAITDPAAANVVAAALHAAGDAQAWAGAPPLGELPSAPTIVRRIGERTLVCVLDAGRLLPDLGPRARVMVTADNGALLYASPAFRGAGPRAQDLAAAARRTPRSAAFVRADDGLNYITADARTQRGALHVVVASAAANEMTLWLEALLRFAMLAAAPLAAVGVLYLMQRQNGQRAKLAEAEAERAEAHTRIAADGAKVGLLEWRPDADEVQLSEQAVRLIGAHKDTLGLRELLELVITEDRFAAEEEFRRARQSGLLDARFRVERGAGVAWIETRGTAVTDAYARTQPRLFCSVVDATQRYEAEARVSRLERQLRAAIESFSGPFALWDSRRRLLLWNQSFATMFALGPELLRPRASYEAVWAASAARIRREKHDPADPDVRVVELATGEWLHIVERRAADGGIITIGVDITQLKRKEEELARNERRLQDALTRAESQEYRIKALAREAHEERHKAEEASHAKSAFLANMSHELRTPLNAVIGFSEIMAKELFGAIGNDQYRQYSSDIYDSGNHLLDLINDILDMAKIEAGKLTLAPRALDPMVAIDQAVRLTKRKAEEKGLQIVVDAEELPEIEADHRAVKQMLLNLLSNALKFTDKGAIMVHARANATGLTLRVIDTGCGIAPEHLPRLAQPFQQVETELARNHHGTGLGLALTKSLAEMHGGKLTLQSEVGRGTIASIVLPRVFGGPRAEATAA